MDFETTYVEYQKKIGEMNKKRDYSRLKLLTAKEIVDKIVKGDKNFSNVRIVGVDWARRDLSGLNFSGSKIEWCIFSGCKIKNADFSNSFIDWCLFESVDLSKSNFKNSIVWNTGFLDADLSNVDFSNSDLEWVVLANVIGRPNLTNCTENKVFYSIEDAMKETDFERLYQWIGKSGLPISQALTFKVKINELWSSGEKLKFIYDMGRQAFNPEGNLGTYNLKKAGKNSLGEYKSEDSGVYTSKTKYGDKSERKRTDAYSR